VHVHQLTLCFGKVTHLPAVFLRLLRQ
jgi:hypothetical protein